MKKHQKILDELFREAFAASTPPADWDAMKAKGEAIPVMAHYCPQSRQDEIFEAVMAKYKVPKQARRGYFSAYNLGPSPTSVQCKPEN